MNAREFALGALGAADLPDLTDLWVAAWRATGMPVDFEARREWFIAHLEKLASSGADIVVARDGDGALAGFVTMDRESGHLDQLCVAPARQGEGVARVLLGEAKARAPGCVRLEVNADNLRACRFYQREGFVATGRGVSPLSGLPILFMQWNAAGIERKQSAEV